MIKVQCYHVKAHHLLIVLKNSNLDGTKMEEFDMGTGSRDCRNRDLEEIMGRNPITNTASIQVEEQKNEEVRNVGFQKRISLRSNYIYSNYICNCLFLKNNLEIYFVNYLTVDDL